MLLCIAGCSDKEPVPDPAPIAVHTPSAEQVAEGPKEQEPSPVAAEMTIEQAEALAAAGTIDEAAAAVMQILIRDPANSRALFLMANLAAAKGELAEAVDIIREVSPDDRNAYLPSLGQSADWLMLLQRFDEAESNYREILEMVPTAAAARRPLADLLNRSGIRQDAAAAILQLCREGNVTEEELHSLLSVPDAFYDDPDLIAGTEHALIGPTAFARVEFTKGELSKAQQILQPVFQSKPMRPGEQAFFGRLLAENQEFEMMPLWLGRCDATAERYGDYWFAIGAWMIWEQRVDDASLAFAKAVQLVPTDRIALNRLAECFRKQGDQDAVAWCKARAEKISQTLRLSERIGRSEKPTPATLNEMADVLDELDRPFEAIMWRAVGLGYAGAGREEMANLNARRVQLLNEQNSDVELMLPPTARDGLAGKLNGEIEFAASLPRKKSASLSLTQRPVPSRGEARFTNVAAKVGITGRFLNSEVQDERMRLLHEQIGGGVAVLDYDLDGRPDLYFTQGGAEPDLENLDEWNGQEPNQLLRNLGAAFGDTTLFAGADDRGYGQGATSGDFNADGFPDLLIANIGHNRLFINNGDGSFRDASLSIRSGSGRWTTSVAIADLNGDDLPDIVESNYVGQASVFDESELKVDLASGMVFAVRPGDFDGMSDRVFVSDGLGGTRVIELRGGPDDAPADGLAILVADIDGQGGNELFVANDMRANQYWVRSDEQDASSFDDRATVSGCAFSNRGDANACMGVAPADFDGDGDLDFAVTNFYGEPMNFYVQRSPGQFQDQSAKTNLFSISYNVNGFGTQPIDYDNNGRVDLFVMNGHIHDNRSIGLPFKMLPQLIDGSGAKFESLSVQDSSAYFQTPTLGRAAATLDWNGDGRLDLVTTHIDHPHGLLQNDSTTSGEFLQLRCVGTVGERDAIGARVEVQLADRSKHGFVATGDGFACKNEALLSFGLGASPEIQQVTVTWPSGGSQIFQGLAANHRYTLVEGEVNATIDF